jgi:hypothetical protein
MDIASTARRGPQNRSPEQQAAFARMALLPSKAEVLFVRQELGVVSVRLCDDSGVLMMMCVCQPIVRLEGRLHVLPGVPVLFERLIDGLVPYLALPPAHERPLRVQVFTRSALSDLCGSLLTR